MKNKSKIGRPKNSEQKTNMNFMIDARLRAALDGFCKADKSGSRAAGVKKLLELSLEKAGFLE